MGLSDRGSLLMRMWRSRYRVAMMAFVSLLLPGCGLLIDAVEQVWPVTGNRVDIICERERVQVGLSSCCRQFNGGPA